MPHLSIEAKEAIVAKALSRGNRPLTSVAAANNIGLSTLQKWLRRKRNGEPLPGEQHVIQVTGSAHTPPLTHLLATAALDEQAIGAYCRQHGIHSFQLQQWREELMKYPNNSSSNLNDAAELKRLRNENKQLKQDLRRKEKALAETSALLVLKKKANLIWGDGVDD